MSPGGKQYDWEFFLAHAGPDQAAAERLYDLLIPHARVFLSSKSLSLGDLWDEALPRAQQSSLITVVLISPNTGRAWYQREEILAALDLAKRSGQRVVPVFLGGATREEDVPYGLRRLQSARITTETDLKKLAQDLLALVAKQAPIPGGAPPASSAAPSASPASSPSKEEPKGVPVFLLAAKEDKKSVDLLRKHLYLAKREGLVRFWSTADAAAGTSWAEEIEREFDRSALILLFVSSELFPAWDDPDQVPKLPDGTPLNLVEMAIQRFHRGTARVVPILLTKVHLTGSKLSELVPLPRERGAVSEWRDQDAAWASIAKEIRDLALAIKGR